MQGLIHGHKNLRAYNINSGDLFGHRMLDLNAGIHLNEEPLVGVLIEQKLNRTRVIISNFLGQLHAGITKFLDHLFGQSDGRGDLHDFLITSLDRTITFVKMNDIALTVTENLDFQMLSPPDISF